MRYLAIFGAIAMLAAACAAPAQAQNDLYDDEYYENGYYNAYWEDEPRYYGERTELWGEERDELEYEAGEGLHEEEWYDPSDWIDFDEGIEYEDDYDEYGYYDDDYADDDWFYDYYDYGYDYAY